MVAEAVNDARVTMLNKAVLIMFRRRGRIHQVFLPTATTSGRRLAAWGNLYATYVHFAIGLQWWFGKSPQKLAEKYHRLYTDTYR